MRTEVYKDTHKDKTLSELVTHPRDRRIMDAPGRKSSKTRDKHKTCRHRHKKKDKGRDI